VRRLTGLRAVGGAVTPRRGRPSGRLGWRPTHPRAPPSRRGWAPLSDAAVEALPK